MMTTDKVTLPTALEQYFKQFRDPIVGIDQEFTSPFGKMKIVYRLNCEWAFVPSD
jgi:hypothetical protein